MAKGTRITVDLGSAELLRAVKFASVEQGKPIREIIIEALTASRGNQSRAAEYLDTSLRILGYKIKRYGLDPREYRNP